MKSDNYYDKHVKDGKSINFDNMLEEGSSLPITREEEERLRHEINTYYQRHPELKNKNFKICDGIFLYTIENYGLNKYKILDMEFIE